MGDRRTFGDYDYRLVRAALASSEAASREPHGPCAGPAGPAAKAVCDMCKTTRTLRQLAFRLGLLGDLPADEWRDEDYGR